VTIHYKFDPGVSLENQERIKGAIAKAVEAGEIVSCPCSSVDAWVYETRPPDFQASLSCSCNAMRPLFSSTPDTEESS
jgi:hypothetical protein